MRTTILGVALAALLAVVPAASAGTITYEKGGDVWLAQPDGSGQRQVTSGGGYASPSLADDGTIVAAFGTRLRRLRPDGTIVSEIATVVANANWHGPLDPDVSPDGTKIVYEWEYRHDADLPGCPLSEQECRNRVLGGASTITWSDRFTDREVLGRLEDSEPTWVDDTRLLLRSPTLGLPVWAAPPSGGGLLFDADVRLWDPTATRDGSMFAFVTQNARSFIAVWKSDGAFPGGGRPTGCFAYQGPNGRFDDPSFSPDGDQLIWQEDDGIWSGAVDNGCARPAAAPKLLIPGGRSPDFGGPPKPPPPPPPEERRPPVEQPPAPRPPVEKPPVPVVVPVVRAPQIALAGRAPTLRSLTRRRTLTVRLSCDGACDLRLAAALPRALAKRLRLKSATVASARGAGSGTIAVRFTLTRRVAALLARQRGAVAVVVSGSGSYGAGRRATVRTTVTLRR